MSKNTYLDLMKNKADKLNTVRFDHENEDQTVTLSYFDGEEWKELSNLGSGGGGGGGSLGKGSLTSTFNKTVVQSDEEVTIDYFYSSPNGNGVLYVILNNNQVVKENIGQGDGKVELGVLPKGTNVIRIYVIDKAGTYTDALSFNVSCGTLEIECNFNDQRDYMAESNIVFQFNVECVNDEPITFHMLQNGKYVKDPYTVSKGWNAITFPKYGPGIYKIEMYCQTVSYKSNVLTFTLYVLAGDSIFISSTFDKEEVPEGETIRFDYRVSMKNQSYFNCKYYIDGQEKKSGQIQAGTDYWSISGLPIGGHQLKIVATTVDGQYSAELLYDILIVESEYNLVKPYTDLIKAWFDASTKSNGDSDKDVWTSKYPDSNGEYATAKLYGFNFSSNGWVDGKLKCDGNSYVEVDLKPFEDNVSNGGLTIDIVFETADVGNQDARVLDCSDLTTIAGCYIDTQNAYFNTKGGTTLKSAFSENTETRITFVVDRDSQYLSQEKDEEKNGKWCDNPMIQIYVNGIFSEIGLLADSRNGSQVYYENIDHAQKLYINTRKGIDCFGSCTIKHLRIYECALKHEQILQNILADIEDPEKQQEEYRKNYEDEMPTMRITTYGKMNPAYAFDKMTKEYDIPVSISFQAIEKYGGSSFELDFCRMKWQGTSTIQYAVKNYKIFLYENGSVPIVGDEFDQSGRKNYKYKQFGEQSIGEHKWTLKADYMDSSMANNTGNTSFIGDYLYDNPVPPAKVDPRIRSCCKGYPIQLYIDGEYAGIYNFMMDKNQDDHFGFDVQKDSFDPNWKTKFPFVRSYEGSANSDNTAGAFNAWNASRGVDLNTWYSADFEQRYPDPDDEPGLGYDELHRLVDFIDNSTDSEFRANFDQYMNREYCFRYFIFAYTFGCVDSLGKNVIISTWDGKIWYFCWYDVDTCLGLD